MADFDAQLKRVSERVTSNKTKHLLTEKELKKINKKIWFNFFFLGGGEAKIILKDMIEHKIH